MRKFQVSRRAALTGALATALAARADTGGAGTPAAGGGGVVAHSTQELWDALKAAPGGATIQLAAGVNFGSFFPPARDFRAKHVNVVGQPGAHFTHLEGVMQGINWKNFNVLGANPSVQIGNSDGVTFTNVTVRTGNANGAQTGQAFQIRNSSNITITGAGDSDAPDISGAGNACSIIDSSHVVLNQLTITNNGVDGILVDGSSDVVIDGVLGYNFYSGQGAHPDFIQGFGDGSVNNKRVTIRNCGWLRGVGDPCQGYFFASSDDLTIDGNYLFGGHLTAVANGVGTKALINNNFCQGYKGQGSAIVTRGAYVDCTVTNNFAGAVNNYAGDGVNPGYVPAKLPGTNTLIGDARSPTDYADLDKWLAANPNARRRPTSF